MRIFCNILCKQKNPPPTADSQTHTFMATRPRTQCHQSSVNKHGGPVNVMAWPCHSWVSLLHCEDLCVQREAPPAPRDVRDLSQQQIHTSSALWCSLAPSPPHPFVSRWLHSCLSPLLLSRFLSLSHNWRRNRRLQLRAITLGKRVDVNQRPSGGGEREVCRVAGGEVSRAVQGAAACWDNKMSTWWGGRGWHKKQRWEKMWERYADNFILWLNECRKNKAHFQIFLPAFFSVKANYLDNSNNVTFIIIV